MTRSQFLIAQVLINAIKTTDSAFNAEGTEKEMTAYEISEISRIVAHNVCASQVKNCMAILEMTQRKAAIIGKKEPKHGN
jgi:hypothetical protein